MRLLADRLFADNDVLIVPPPIRREERARARFRTRARPPPTRVPADWPQKPLRSISPGQYRKNGLALPALDRSARRFALDRNWKPLDLCFAPRGSRHSPE